LSAEAQKEREQKRATEVAEAQKKAQEAKRVAAENERRRAEEEARQREAQEALRQRQQAELVASQAKSAHDAELKAEARRRDAARPVWKKAWFWGVMAAAVVVVGASVGAGVAVGTRERDPIASFGRVSAP
jgi:hypothetical protein